MNDPNQAVQWSKWCTFTPVHSLSSGYNIIKTQGFWKRPRSVVICYGSFTVKTQWLSFLSAVGLSIGSSPETVKKTVTALACNMQIDQFWSASGWEQGIQRMFWAIQTHQARAFQCWSNFHRPWQLSDNSRTFMPTFMSLFVFPHNGKLTYSKA